VLIGWCCSVIAGAFFRSQDVPETTNEQHLIKTGLYHIIRNPAYTGSIISLLGVALVY